MELISNLTNLFIFFLTLFIGVITWVGLREIKRNDDRDIEHSKMKDQIHLLDKELQSVKDIQGHQITNLFDYLKEFKSEFKQDLGEFKDEVKSDMKSLKTEVHDKKNYDGTLVVTMSAILKHLDKIETQNEKLNKQSNQ